MSFLLNALNVGDFPFINLVKGMDTLDNQSGTTIFQNQLNADSYPNDTASLSVRYRRTFIVPNAKVLLGKQFLVKWSGTGTIQLSGGTTVVSGNSFVVGSTAANMLMRGTNGRIVYTYTDSTQSTVTLDFINGNAFTGFGNLVVCLVENESLLDGGEIFNPDFIAKLVELNPVAIRSPEADGTNVAAGTNITKAAYISQATNLSWFSQRYLPSVWVGDAGSGAGVISGTDTYTCAAATDTPATWTDGETFQGQVTNTNTVTTPTIDVNGRGAKTIVDMGGNAITVGAFGTGNSVRGYGTFVYNALLDKVLYSPGGLTKCMPITVIVALCNKIGCGMYHDYMFLLLDSEVTTVATTVLNNLNEGAPYLVGFGNENWNFVYAQTQIGKKFGAALGFSAANSRQELGWWGLRHRQVMGLITSVWSGRTELKRVIEPQAYAASDIGTLALVKTYLLEGSDLGSWGYNSSPNRPIDYTDYIAYAPYYNGAICRGFDTDYVSTGLSGLTGAADDYASGDATRMAAALDWLDNDVRAGTKNSVLGTDTLLYQVQSVYPGWDTTATTYGKQIIQYENAFQCIAPTTSKCTSLGISTSYGGSSGTIQSLIEAYKYDFRFYTLSRDQVANYMAKSKSLYPNWYGFGVGSQWGLRPGNLYTEYYQSYDMIALANSAKRRFMVKT